MSAISILILSFYDRELCLKVIVVFVVVGVETWVKNGSNGTKNVRKQNLF